MSGSPPLVVVVDDVSQSVGRFPYMHDHNDHDQSAVVRDANMQTSAYTALTTVIRRFTGAVRGRNIGYQTAQQTACGTDPKHIAAPFSSPLLVTRVEPNGGERQ